MKDDPEQILADIARLHAELHEWIERVIVWGFKQGNLPLARKLLEYGIDHLRLCQEFERWIEEGDNFRSHS